MFVKLLPDYLNVCDHNPSTLQKVTRGHADRQTDGRTTFSILFFIASSKYSLRRWAILPL